MSAAKPELTRELIDKFSPSGKDALGGEDVSTKHARKLKRCAAGTWKRVRDSDLEPPLPPFSDEEVAVWVLGEWPERDELERVTDWSSLFSRSEARA